MATEAVFGQLKSICFRSKIYFVDSLQHNPLIFFFHIILLFRHIILQGAGLSVSLLISSYVTTTITIFLKNYPCYLDRTPFRSHVSDTKVFLSKTERSIMGKIFLKPHLYFQINRKSTKSYF